MKTEPKPDPAAVDLAARIRSGVLASLGRPPDLLRVAVTPLWGSRYRVNVLTGPDPSAATLAGSFFVTADDTGAIVTSVPEIIRRY